MREQILKKPAAVIQKNNKTNKIKINKMFSLKDFKY